MDVCYYIGDDTIESVAQIFVTTWPFIWLRCVALRCVYIYIGRDRRVFVLFRTKLRVGDNSVESFLNLSTIIHHPSIIHPSSYCSDR